MPSLAPSRILSRDRSILQSLLDEAREGYRAAEKKVISIYAADTYVLAAPPYHTMGKTD